jgi:hypothetical protein
VGPVDWTGAVFLWLWVVQVNVRNRRKVIWVLSEIIKNFSFFFYRLMTGLFRPTNNSETVNILDRMWDFFHRGPAHLKSRSFLDVVQHVVYCSYTVLRFIALYCTALHCTALYCTLLYYAALYCTALHCTALHCTALHCTALHCTVLHCTVLHCIALYCTALHCAVLHSTVLCCTVQHCSVQRAVWAQ